MKLDGKSNPELMALREAVCAAPDARSPAGSLFMFVPKIRRKLDEIDRQITHNLRTARIARGETINDAGYSGRQTNRR